MRDALQRYAASLVASSEMACPDERDMVVLLLSFAVQLALNAPVPAKSSVARMLTNHPTASPVPTKI
jgi:hypothetical protein